MKIALLSTPYLKTFYESSVTQLGWEDTITIHVYHTYQHIVELYQQLETQYDGFLVGGTAPMRIIEGAYQEHKPLRYIKCGISNFYREITRAMLEYQDFDLKYAYFDFCDYIYPGREYNLAELMKTGSLETWFLENEKYMDSMSADDMRRTLEETGRRHVERWNSGTIKYALSRRSLILPDILKAGVNCRFIYCSLEDIAQSYELLTNDIRIARMEKHQAACIGICASPMTAENMHTIRKKLEAFSKKHFVNFIAEDQGDRLQLFSDCETISRITCGFRSSSIKQFIEAQTDFQVCIGYGMGDTIQSAVDNSKNAMKESQHVPDHVSYLMNEIGDRICLSGEDMLVTIPGDVTPHILRVVEKTGFSTLTVQKIMKAREVLGEQEFTSQDLAQILHITLRSANRILDQLVRYQMAIILYRRQSGTKGRPQNVYQML